MDNSIYAEYLKQDNKYDMYTVQGMLDYGEGGYFGRMHPKMLPIILEELSTSGRIVLSRLLQLLTTKDNEECKSLVGFAGYRYIIQSSQKNLGDILQLKQQYISNGLDDLEKHGIILRKDSGIILINPLVYSKDSIFDVRCLQEFGITLQTDEKGKVKRFKSPSNKNKPKIERKKVNPANIRTDMGF